MSMSEVTIVRQLNIIDEHVYNPDSRIFTSATLVLLTVPGMNKKQLTTRSGQYFLETSMENGEVKCCENVPANLIINHFVEEYSPQPTPISPIPSCPCPIDTILTINVIFTGNDITRCGCIINFYAGTRTLTYTANCHWEGTFMGGYHRVTLDWDITLCAWILRVYCIVGNGMIQIWEGINYAYSPSPYGAYISHGQYCGNAGIYAYVQ